MKRFLFLGTLVIAICRLSAHGQGTVIFYNHLPTLGIDAPVFDLDGRTKLSGSDYVAQLWAGASATNLSPVTAPAPFQTGAGAGYWIAPASETAINTIAPGKPGLFQVVVWTAASGPTPDAALKSQGKIGWSSIFSATTGGETPSGGGPPGPPTGLKGLVSFNLVSTVPEPGGWVLVLTGMSVILASRRGGGILRIRG